MKKKKRVLVIDDEPEMLNVCSKILVALGYNSIPVQDGESAIKLLQEGDFDLVLSDLLMPGVDGMKILQTTLTYSPNTPVIIFTAYGTVDRAVIAMKNGAFDFIEKPFETEHLKVVLEKGIKQRQLLKERDNLLNQLENKYSFDNIIGKCPAMINVFEMVDSVANSDSNVLITGESGTGKELIARSIHIRSQRRTEPFVPVNCGAFPENLFETELFGYEKGAFTGATKRKIGLLEYADRGTFFLDEGCELPVILQTKLLRVLQNNELRHIGGNELIQVDVRLISATNRDIQKALADRIIRDDFYYRLNVINIHLPPIRERKEDIPLLVEYFLEKALKSSPKEISGFSDEVMYHFGNYDWPGNVREIENVVERAVTIANTNKITTAELPQELQLEDRTVLSFDHHSLTNIKKQAITDVEMKYLFFQLKKHKGNITNIAIEAGMTRRNIHHLLKRYKLDPNDWRSS
jgi:two-component system NtrC family response regulator/two-component system response regulator AtoC